MKMHETAALIKQADHILILSHKRPDGDTIGSCAALCRALRQAGKTAFVYANPEITPRFSALFEGLQAKENFLPEFVISCDIAAPDLLPLGFDAQSFPIDLCIDHHKINTISAKYDLIDAQAAACGEIIFELLAALGQRMDEPIARSLYIAVSTDTGCFKYANTTAHTHRVAAACFEAGIDAGEINREIFDRKTRARFEVEKYIWGNLEFYLGGRSAIVTLSRKTIDQIGATEDDLDNIAALPRQIDGVWASIVLTETTDGNTKVSVRTAQQIDAAKLCQRFGGGGHQRAAGATLAGEPEKNLQKVKEASVQCIQELL